MFAALRVEVRVSPARVILPLRAFGPRTRQMLAIVCVSACALLQFGVTPHTHTHQGENKFGLHYKKWYGFEKLPWPCDDEPNVK